MNATSEYEDNVVQLHRAAVEGHLREVETLLSGENEDEQVLAKGLNHALEYPLYSALALSGVHEPSLIEDKKAIFTRLLALTPDVLAHQNRQGETVLHRMAKNGFEGLLPQVLSSEANESLLFIKNTSGQCPIHTAVLNGRIQVAQALLKHDQVSSLLDDEGHLPLHLAASVGSFEMVKLCLKAYPEGLEVKDEREKTPLDLALASNTTAVQNYLREQGAESNPVSQWSETFAPSHLK